MVSEESVLQPRSPSFEHSDDWPTFNLTKINITSQRTGQQVSLLSANKSQPVKVSGRLEKIDEEWKHLIRDKRYREKHIELYDITTYAFAEYNDGSYGFWAAGKAGWFELQAPKSSYKLVYTSMDEAASMFYLLADKLKRAAKKRPKMSTKALDTYAFHIFQDYLAQRKNSIRFADIDDVRESFSEQRQFLITSMLESQEGLDWSETPMFNYFKLRYPEDFAEIRARVLGSVDTRGNGSEDNEQPSKKRKSQSLYIEGIRKKTRGQNKTATIVEQPPDTLAVKTLLDASSSGDEISQDLTSLPRKRKSILQPSGGKYTRKAAGRRRSPPVLYNNQHGEHDSNNEPLSSEEPPVTTLRNAEDLKLVTNPPTNRPFPDDNSGPKFLPRKYLELKVVEYDLPSSDPQGPGDLWTCTFEGCFYRVHEASTPDGKLRIKEHFRNHASQAQEKIDLVLTESRPYLPVSNLVRRLQAFAPPPGTDPGPESLERKFSAPIRRKY